jgi:16S rRNA (cytidine1402-2'-O)-methyltransferase
MPGKLILIPNTLGSTDPNTFLPSSSIGQITSLKYLIVENIRNAMASGLNGQSFRFVGYLPIKNNERIHAIKLLEKRALSENETQIFIETPYRNIALLNDILSTCNNMTMLTIAADISTETEMIRTDSVGSWKKKKPELHKRPAVFLLGKR